MPFVAIYSGGSWKTQNLAGAPSGSGQAEAITVSCGASGYCTAGGYYVAPGSLFQAFVVNDVNGTWASAQNVAGPVTGNAQISVLSCTTAGYCTAIGAAGTTTFTANEATASAVTLTASAPTVVFGDEEAETLTAAVTSPAGGTQTGTVTVNSGSVAVCTITLASGSGTCPLTANLTAVSPTANTYITAYPDGETRPATSNLDVVAGQTTPNLVIVPVSIDGKIDLYNNTGSVNLLADLAGYYYTN